MIFDPTTAPHLKPWLVRTLEPICDAEPGALADYILALLKHNVPESEMRKELALQLEEFLENEVPPFIDTLFTTLRTKSYLPYTTATPPTPTSYPTSDPQNQDTGIPIPLDALLSPSVSSSPERGRKRSNENDERDGRPPAKGPRLSTEGQFSRYTNGGSGDVRSTGGWGGQSDMNGHGQGGNLGMGGGYMGYTNGRRPQTYQPPDQKRGICRDYHNNGFCARGEYCRYSHGDDAVVPGQLFPMNGPTIGGVPMPFMPMFPGAMPFGMGGAGAAYDPHEARMDMRPQPGGRISRAPIMPRIPQENGPMQNVPGELPVIQDLTPELPPEVPTTQDSQNASDSSEVVHRNDTFIPTGGMDDMVSQHPQAMIGPTDVEMAPPLGGPLTPNGHRNVRSGRPARGHSSFGDAHSFRPERRNDKTLVVEKIPDDKINLRALNEWFKKFGTVTNVAIDAKNKKALVSFSEHSEAHAAWKSEDAVFNNRFVKLFWHRPMEGHGQTGTRMLAASAPLVANIAAKDSVSPAVTSPPPSNTSTLVPSSSATTRKAMASSATATALATKQQLLERQIAEQKSLMASLASASSEEKKQIMTRLRKLGEEMKPTPVTPTSPTSTELPKNARIESTPHTDDHERKIRERLDKELEIHSATVAVQGSAEEKETTEDLKAKLARLKAEAARLGLPEASSQPVYGASHRPYRGRGRASRSYYRGAMRGGPPRGSMTLDNRPKKLLVKGVGEDGLQAVHDWYESAGQLDQVENYGTGDIVVSFKTRLAAEQGLAKGTNIPTIGKVQVTWFTVPKANTANTQKASSPSVTIPNISGDTAMGSERAHSLELENIHPPHIQEEEVVASGWGGDGDGEDGMGML